MCKKILFIIDDLGRGGAEKITVELANFLSDAGNDITLAVLNTSTQEQQPRTRIKLIDLEIRSDYAFGKLWKKKTLNSEEKNRINKMLNSTQYELVILGHHNGYYLYDELNQKNIWHWIHAELIEFRPSSNYLKLLKEYLRQLRHKNSFKKVFNAKNIITVNRNLSDRYSNLVPNSNFTTISNGVIPPLFINTNIEKKWDTIFVGRLVAIKQVDHAIKAFIYSNLPGNMAIIGDGPEKNRLMNLVEELGYKDRIKFLGWIDEPKLYMLESRSLIMSSYYEGSPVTIAEAISLNIPVISYNSSSEINDLFTESFKERCLAQKQNINELGLKLFDIVNTPFHFDQESLDLVSIDRMAKKFIGLTQK